MSNYPVSIYAPRNLVDRVGAVYDASKTKVFYAKDHNDSLAEIVAIENSLGINLANVCVRSGVAYGQTFIGGTGVADILKLQGTSGNGTLTSPAIQAFVGNNGATVALTILNNGNFGIGTTSPGVKLDVSGVIRTSSNFQADGASIHAMVLGSTGSAFNFTGWNGSAGVSLLYISNGNNSVTVGNVGIGTASPGVLLTLSSAGYFGWDNGSGTVDASFFRAASGVIRTASRIDTTNSNGVMSNVFKQYGAIYVTIGNGTNPVYLNGSTGVGITAPTARLHLPAGTSSVSTAPLKFTSGTNLTTAEAGGMEYDNTFHLTNSDATRRHIVTAPNTTKVVAAAPYANDGYVVINIGGTDFKVMTTA